MKILNNWVVCWSRIPRTLQHYMAFLKLEKQLLGTYKYRFHDLDKVLMYLFIPWAGPNFIRKVHRKINKHHIENYKLPNQCNYEEAVIDWECCRFTKPDEPMNAREYLESIKDELEHVHYIHMDVALKKFNL